MSVFDRTLEQAKALHQIQQSFTPEILDYLNELAAMMKNMPPEDIDRECNNIGYLLHEILEKEISSTIRINAVGTSLRGY
jgi:hypothetical protein